MSNAEIAASELRRPPGSADRQDHERRAPRLNPPTASGRCMSSQMLNDVIRDEVQRTRLSDLRSRSQSPADLGGSRLGILGGDLLTATKIHRFRTTSTLKTTARHPAQHRQDGEPALTGLEPPAQDVGL